MTIWFDMDGTLFDLYGVENWLEYLQNEDTYPYAVAKPMVNFALLARYIHKLQPRGVKFGIVSCTSKSGTKLYHAAIADTKINSLDRHLPSVHWDYIKIIPYGTNKYMECGGGILFDDEKRNRDQWGDESYEPSQIMEVLKSLLRDE